MCEDGTLPSPAMASSATVSNALITAILDGVGLDMSDKVELLSGAGLRLESVQDINARTSLVGLWRLWDRVLRHTQDDYVGLRIGLSIPADRFGLAVHAAHNSENLRQSLQRFAKHIAIINGMIRCSVKDSGGRVAFDMRFHWDVLDLERHAVDIAFAGLLRWAQHHVSPEFRPCKVQLRHARCGALPRYEEVFAAPVMFGQSVNALVFDAALLEAPVRASNPELGSILEHHADLELSRLPALGSLPDRVRQILGAELREGRKLDLAGVAKELRMSSRALQRKLGEASTSFSALLDDARRVLAPELLGAPDANVEQVGYQLGYAEPTTFIRAFKKWYGITPGRHRSDHRGS